MSACAPCRFSWVLLAVSLVVAPIGCESGENGETTKPAAEKPSYAPAPSGIAVEKGASCQVGDVYLAGQPTEAGFEAAAKKGVKTVINLRLPVEQPDYDEKAQLESLGMTYVSLPVTPQTLREQADAFSEALNSAEKPVLVHCASGNRVAALWAIHLSQDRGLTSDEALAVAEKSGLTKDALKKLVRDHLEDKAEEAADPQR